METTQASYWQLIKRSYGWFGPAFWQATPMVLMALAIATALTLIGLGLAFGLASAWGGHLPLIISSIFVILSILGSCYFYGVIVLKLWALLHGESTKKQEFWSLALRKTGTVFFAIFFLNVIILAVDVIVIGLSVATQSLTLQIIASIIASIVVTYISIKLIFWSTIVVIEDTKLMMGMWRSWQLTTNNFWRVGVVIGLVVGVPVAILWGIAAIGGLWGKFIPILVSMGSILVIPPLVFIAILYMYRYLINQENNQPV